MSVHTGLTDLMAEYHRYGHVAMPYTQERALVERLDALLASAVEEEIEVATEAEDQHCATCQCRGTVCNKESWCKRTWGHGSQCSKTRDENF